MVRQITRAYLFSSKALYIYPVSSGLKKKIYIYPVSEHTFYMSMECLYQKKKKKFIQVDCNMFLLSCIGSINIRYG